MALRRLLLDVAPLRSSPPFRRLWIGQTLSGFGSQLTAVAVMFQVWRTTGSPVWTGAVGLAQVIPLVAFGFFAGSLADRADRRTVYLVMTGGQAGCALLLALQTLLDRPPIVGVLLLVAAQAACAAGAGPVSRAVLPCLLPRHELAAGLALRQLSFQGAMLVGPALGGLIVSGAGAGACYAIDAVTFGAVFLGALGLPQTPAGDGPARPGASGILDGLAFLAGTPVVRGALLTDLATTVLSMPISLFPLINSERFGGDPRTLGLFLTAVAAGGVTASLFSGVFTRLARPGLLTLAASAVWGGALMLFGMSSRPWWGFALLALAGAADTVSVVARGTIVQTHTPARLLGRVAAAEQVVGQAGPELGNLRGGLVAGATTGTTALVSGGLLCLAAVTAVAIRTPGLRRSPAPLSPSAAPAVPECG
ncbi:MFS transporter [Streptomyces sp. LP05-1]|uniref:MFS transporter n=1 Tax=Streptomyces pyxinae TaxID=2970734 RepID=A0ABT2CF44_9ACTN|nr:MFS transporter [Streptomyces sp. LP05-1]MCS0635356.1 MFS transporter [Streptomyces sp. LP05-1]